MGNPTVHRKWLALFKGRLQVNVGGFLSGRETKGPHRVRVVAPSRAALRRAARGEGAPLRLPGTAEPALPRDEPYSALALPRRR